MKKILLLMALVLATVSARAFTISLDIDDASRCQVEVDNNGTLTQVTNLVNGRNPIVIDADWVYVTIMPTAGSKIVAVYYQDAPSWDETISPDGTCTFRASSYDDGEYWTVITEPLGDARTASATVTVDDASKVSLKRGNDPVELVNGPNTVKFDPATESKFYISPSSVDGSIYRILLNDKDVSSAAFTTVLTVANDDKIVIDANWPDESYDVTINVTGDYADDRFITNVFVDGTPVTGDKYSFKAKAGSELTISADTQDWEVTSFSVNGASGFFGSNWRHTVSGETTLDFTVRRYSTIRVTVLASPDVIVYRGLHYNGDIVQIDPATGSASVDLRRDTPILSFKPAAGYYLDYAAVGSLAGTEFAPTDIYSSGELKTAVLQIGSLEEGDAVKVTAAEMDLSAKAAVIISDYATVSEYIKLTDALGNAYPLDGTRTILSFDPWVSPFTLEYGGPFTSYVYLDTEAVSATYPGSIKYELNLAGGEIVKTFADTPPTRCTVDVNLSAEAAGKATVKADGFTTLTPGTGIAMLSGTVLTVAPADAATPLAVSVAGTALTPAADGTFTYTVEGNVAVDITTAAAAGITDITAGDAPDALYNLQGVRVSGDRLPAGLYLKADGTKVLVK